MKGMLIATGLIAALVSCHAARGQDRKEAFTQGVGDYACGSGKIIKIIHTSNHVGSPRTYVKLEYMININSGNLFRYFSYAGEKMVGIAPAKADGKDAAAIYNEKRNLLDLAHRRGESVRIVAPVVAAQIAKYRTAPFCSGRLDQGLDVQVCAEKFKDVCNYPAELKFIKPRVSESVYN